jgi:hypothetical protein
LHSIESKTCQADQGRLEDVRASLMNTSEAMLLAMLRGKHLQTFSARMLMEWPN